MDNNTVYTILLRYFKTLSYTGYVLLQDLLYLIVLLYIKELPYITLLQEQKAIINKAILIILSRCTFCLNSCEIKDITPPSYENVDYNIDFFNINLSRDSILLTIALGENLKSVTIPYVTLLTAGVASASDKVVIDRANYVINKEPVVGSISVGTQGNNVSIGYLYVEGGNNTVSESVNLPLATITSAGLLSKEDKNKLDLLDEDIAEAEISGFTKELSPNKVTLKLESANLILSLDLNRASALGAGVVSSSDIDVIDKFKNLFYYKSLVDDLAVTPTLNTVEITYQYFDPNDYSVYSDNIIIPLATTEKAGVMSTADKTVVDKANSLINSHPLVDKLSFAVSNNKRYLLYTLNGNSTSTGIEVPLFGETLQVLADKTLTGSESCYILLYGSNVSGDPISSIALPRVNEFHDGVLSSAKYLEFNNTASSIEGIYSSINGLNNTVVTTVDIGYNLDSVDVNLLTQNSNPIESNIEAATTTRAGVMSAEDKLLLTNVVSEMPTVSDSIEDGIKLGLHYVVKNNLLIAVMKDGLILYAPIGVIYTKAISDTSITIDGNLYNIKEGEQYTVLKSRLSSLANTILSNFIEKIIIYADSSEVTNMSVMFMNSLNIKSINILSLNTAKVTNLANLATNCPLLEEFISNLDTSRVTSMRYMFKGCTNLRFLDITNWDTSKVTGMAETFKDCKNLTQINLQNFDFSSCTTAYYMLGGCSSIVSVTLNSSNNPVLTDIRGLIAACSSLLELNIDNFDVSAVTTMDGALSSLPLIKQIIIPSWKTTNLQNSSYLFSYNTRLEIIDISNFNMSNITIVGLMFYYCSKLHTLKFPNMGLLKANGDNNKVVDLSSSPLGSPIGITDPNIIAESEKSLMDLFSYDRVANGLTNPLTVKLSNTTKGLTHIFTDEAFALISARGYTIA